jgi:hypothetical protein
MSLDLNFDYQPETIIINSDEEQALIEYDIWNPVEEPEPDMPTEPISTVKKDPELPEQKQDNKLAGLENVIWDDVETLHPMLDFKNGVAYVAVNLDFEASPVVRHCPFTVTSDGSFFETNDPAAHAKRGIRNSHPLIEAPGRWKKNLLKEYLEGKTVLDPAKLFRDIKGQYERYVRFEEQSTYAFAALWTIGTYMFPIFDAFPMVLLCGPKGSGKTRTLQIATLLTFNGRLQGDPTPATVFRTIDEERPTLIFDEMEWLSKKDVQNPLTAIFKFGYKFGCTVPRCTFDAKGNSHVVQFDAYCPKMFANIHGLEDVLGDRAITFYQRRKTDEDIVDVASPSESDSVWAELRHALYVFMLTHWKTVKELIPTKNVPINNRNLELFSSTLALARFFNDYAGIDGLYDEMITLATIKAAERKENDKETSHESILIQALKSLVKADGWFSSVDVINEMRKFFSDGAEWINCTWMGKALSRIGIAKVEGARQRKHVHVENAGQKYLSCYYITQHEVDVLAEQYSVDFNPKDAITDEDIKAITSC